ncbi:MAG: four helix bundle protein [Bacteroidales bacterium]|nr:four helix bundle protein [Bacteroidales bacterium]
MAKIETFEDLVVWKEARELVGIIYKEFGNSKDYSFKDQIQRASVSIMNNISEGFERGSNAEFIRFLFIAKASAGEVRSMIYIANDISYINSETTNDLLSRTRKLSGSISNFIKYLKANPFKK